MVDIETKIGWFLSHVYCGSEDGIIAAAQCFFQGNNTNENLHVYINNKNGLSHHNQSKVDI